MDREMDGWTDRQTGIGGGEVGRRWAGHSGQKALFLSWPLPDCIRTVGW